jgi:hypothetical protein
VLIDLKRDKLTHQDLGQMQMYVNYFDRYVKTEDELYLPSKEELRRQQALGTAKIPNRRV